jgi:hypothetical protein
MRTPVLNASSFVAVLLFSSVALAGSVFLNGDNIDGVRNQVYDNARVEIDAQGNIKITVKSPQAAAPSTPAPAAPSGAPTKRYYLVTEKAAPGMTQYDIDLFVNGKWVRKFLDTEEHVVMEVTQHLKVGNNAVTFIARKNMAPERKSSSPTHFFRIVMGEGEEGGRNVMINKKLIDYRRTALETKDMRDDMTLTAQ